MAQVKHLAAGPTELDQAWGVRHGFYSVFMADYQASGVSEEYLAKEQRWNTAAGEVREIIRTLRVSLERNDASAQEALGRAKAERWFDA